MSYGNSNIGRARSWVFWLFFCLDGLRNLPDFMRHLRSTVDQEYDLESLLPKLFFTYNIEMIRGEVKRSVPPS